MKPIMVVGLFLVAIGLIALVYQGITYTTYDTVIDIGPLHATAERQRTIPLPPLLGGAAVVAGGVLIGLGLRKTA